MSALVLPRCSSRMRGDDGIWRRCELGAGHDDAHRSRPFGDAAVLEWSDT